MDQFGDIVGSRYTCKILNTLTSFGQAHKVTQINEKDGKLIIKSVQEELYKLIVKMKSALIILENAKDVEQNLDCTLFHNIVSGISKQFKTAENENEIYQEEIHKRDKSVDYNDSIFEAKFDSHNVNTAADDSHSEFSNKDTSGSLLGEDSFGALYEPYIDEPTFEDNSDTEDSFETDDNEYWTNDDYYREFDKRYTMGSLLGEGGFGAVFAGYRNLDNFPVAIKGNKI